MCSKRELSWTKLSRVKRNPLKIFQNVPPIKVPKLQHWVQSSLANQRVKKIRARRVNLPPRSKPLKSPTNFFFDESSTPASPIFTFHGENWEERLSPARCPLPAIWNVRNFFNMSTYCVSGEFDRQSAVEGTNNPDVHREIDSFHLSDFDGLKVPFISPLVRPIRPPSLPPSRPGVLVPRFHGAVFRGREPRR